jgi:hypothetical protein
MYVIIGYRTFNLLEAAETNHMTSTDQDQLKHPYRLIMICTVHYSVSTYFNIFPETDEWLCPIERWTSPIKMFSLVRFKTKN